MRFLWFHKDTPPEYSLVLSTHASIKMVVSLNLVQLMSSKCWVGSLIFLIVLRIFPCSFPTVYNLENLYGCLTKKQKTCLSFLSEDESWLNLYYLPRSCIHSLQTVIWGGNGCLMSPATYAFCSLTFCCHVLMRML